MASENQKQQKPSSIFDLPSSFFDFASILRRDAANSGQELVLHPWEVPSNLDSQIGEEEDKQVSHDMTRWTCNTCGMEFSSLEEQRSHFKSDFHRFNVKRRMIGRDPIKEDEFEEVAQGTLLKEDDISSISGSEEELEEPLTCNNQSPSESVSENLAMRSQISVSLQSRDVVSIWRCLLLGDKEYLALDDKNFVAKESDGQSPCLTDDEVVRRLRSLVQESRDQKNLRVVLLASGGHFAGCVFDGNTIVSHKTYHRYVVRAKAGGRQSTKDASGRAPKSAGASLRRYNEMALKKAEKDAKRKAKAKEMKKLRKTKEKAQAQSTSLQVASAAVCYGQDAVQQLLTKGKAVPNMQSHAFQEDLKKAEAIEREKRAAAAEKRISVFSNQAEHNATAIPSLVGSRNTTSDTCCSCCATSLAGMIPFHRYNYKYCSTSCMHVHREILKDG